MREGIRLMGEGIQLLLRLSAWNSQVCMKQV